LSTVSVVIPNYNGAKLLGRILPTVLALGDSVAETIVVDDASLDDSVQVVGAGFPSVSVIARESNGGFGAAANDGIKAAKTDYVVLLNSDVEVQDQFLDPILPLFDDPSVFAVCPSILTPGPGGLNDGAKTGRWHHGMFFTGQEDGVSEVRPVLFTSGCASVYRRTMLEELGGFDDAYSPFYWEDVDLSYRAWKRGWKSLYQPTGEVFHKHSSTISKLDRRTVDAIKARNGLLFIWRNIEDKQIRNSHRLWLPLVLAKHAGRGDRANLRGWMEARRRRNDAISARNHDSKHRILSDSQIFEMLGISI
jgi:GT2 family glycosyltransferase